MIQAKRVRWRHGGWGGSDLRVDRAFLFCAWLNILDQFPSANESAIVMVTGLVRVYIF